MANEISAQVSLYPLRQPTLTPVIQEVVALLEQSGLRVEPGRMSTLVVGEENVVFSALQEAFRRAAVHGDIVMQVALSNGCP